MGSRPCIPIVAAVLLATLSLAGCLGTDDGIESRPAFTTTTGSVAGVVLGGSLEPILGGEVGLFLAEEEVMATKTDRQGRYALNHVEPGAYLLIVTAACCVEHARGVDVVAGQVTAVDLLLEPSGPGSTVTRRVVEGFISCGVRQPGTFAMNCPFMDPNTERQLILETDPGLKTIAVAMTWDPPQYSTQPYLYHALFTMLKNEEITGRNYVFQDEKALPGLEYRVDASAEDPLRDWDNATEPIPIEFRIGAGSEGGTNVIYQLRFTLYYHLFHGAPAPEGYSAFPET
jgi:hypothetical protein